MPALVLLSSGQVAAEDRDEGGGQHAPDQNIVSKVGHRESDLELSVNRFCPIWADSMAISR